MNLKTPTLIAIGLLLIALVPMPYGYYTFVRICICLYSVFLAYKSWEEKTDIWMWIFIVLAILFNPILPIYFGRGLWALIDLITAGIFFASLSQLKFDIKNKK